MASHLVTLALENATAGTTIPVRVGNPPNSNEPGLGNSLFSGGNQIFIEVSRAGTTGALTIYGMDVGDPNGAPNQLNSGVQSAQLFKGDGATTTFQTLIPFVALSNNNWLVVLDRIATSSTVTVTAGSNTVTGAATSFLTEYLPGQTCMINGEQKQVLDIASATVMTTVQNFAASAAAVAIFRIGSPVAAASITSITNVGGFALVTMAAAPLANVRMAVYFGTPVVVYTGTDRVKKYQGRSYDFEWILLGATPSATSIWLKTAGTV